MSPFVFGLPAGLATQAVAILLAIVVTDRLARAAGLPTWRVLTALIVLLCAAIAGAVLSAPSFRPIAGLRYPGTGVAVLGAIPVVRRILARSTSVLAFGDLMAAPLAFGMAVAKVGCFLHGCCHGLPSHVPWAVAFPQHSIPWFDQVNAGLISAGAEQSLPVHPLQLYCAAWLVCVGLLVLFLRSRTRRDGRLLLLALSLYAAGLFVADRFKVPPDPLVEITALLMLLVCATAAIVLTVRDEGGADARGLARGT